MAAGHRGRWRERCVAGQACTERKTELPLAAAVPARVRSYVLSFPKRPFAHCRIAGVFASDTRDTRNPETPARMTNDTHRPHATRLGCNLLVTCSACSVTTESRNTSGACVR